MNDNKALSDTINFLRLPLAILVIFIHIPDHSSGIGQLRDQSLEMINFGTLSLYCKLLIETWFSPIAVPLFFFFSGLLLFVNKQKLSIQLYYSKIKSRIYTIVIPFFVWSILYYIIKMFTADAGIPAWWYSFINNKEYVGFFISSSDTAWTWKEGWFGTSVGYVFPDFVPLWFLRDLFILVLVSPVIFFLAKHLPRLSFTALTFCYITTTWFTLPGFYITGVYFFYLGVLLSLKGLSMIDTIEKYTIPIAITAVLSLAYSTIIVFDGEVFVRTPFAVLINSLLVLLLTYKLSKKGYLTFPPLLSSSAMFIYCWHGLPVYGGIPIVYGLFDYFNIDSIIQFAFGPILIALLGFIIFYLMQKYLPFINKVLNGK